jgi:cytochrome c oxidase subunit II
VHIISQDEYDAYLAELASDPDHVSKEPIVGGAYSYTPVLEELNEDYKEEGE